MSALALVLLSLVLAASVWSRAGVDPNDWNVCLLAVGVLTALHFGVNRRRGAPKLDRLVTCSAAVLLIIPVLQILPIPLGFIRILSPARAALIEAAAPFTGGPPRFASLSAVPFNTAQYVVTLAGCAAVILLVRDIAYRTRGLPWAPVWPLLVIAGLEAVLGFYQAVAEGGLTFATGTYANRDHFAGLLEIALPFAALYPVAILQREKRRHESPARPALLACVLIAIAVILLVGIIFSLSRMGFIVALASLFVSGSIVLTVRGWRVDYEDESKRWRKWLPNIPLAFAIIFGFIFLPTDPLVARFAEFARTDDISADTRAQIWRDSVSLVKDYPLTGCGFGTYESCFYRYKQVAPMFTVDYAHNDYLQVLAEAGVIGFAAGLIFLLAILFRAVRGIVYARSIDSRFLNIACVASITGILLHSLVDFNMYVPANAMAFSWVLGIAALNSRSAA